MTEIIYDYPPPVSQLLTLGDCRKMRGRDWPDYLALSLTPAHVPDLIQLALDETLHWADSDSEEVWAPIHAWRALGQLQAAEAGPALLPLTKRVDEHGDDWVGEELPEVYGMIGPVTIPVLTAGLADPTFGLWARVNMAKSLVKVGQRHPAARDECVAVLTHQLEQYAQLDPSLNAFLVSPLIDLKAVESAPVIEAAFAAKKVDLSVAGDWEEVQIELGLLAARLTPKPHFGFFNLFSGPPETAAPAFAQTGSPEAPPRKIQAQSRPQTKAKTRAKNKQASKQRTQQRKKKKK